MKQTQWVRTMMVTGLLLMASVAPALATEDQQAADEKTRQLMERVEQLEKKLAQLEQTGGRAASADAALAVADPAPVATDAAAGAAVAQTVATTEPPPPPPAPKAVYSEPIGEKDDRDVTYGTKSSFLTWHGYLNFEFFKQQHAHSNFDNHEFYLATKARMSERLAFTAEFEYEHTPEKLILPIQAYADLNISPAFTLRSGLWFSPIGMPRGYTLRGNRNRMVRQVALTHDLLFENWSEMGVLALGEFQNGMFYDVGIGNGMPGTIAAGDSWFDADKSLQSHTEDNNDNKALHSRVGYHSAQFAGGEVNTAVSFGTQKYDPAGKKRLTYKGLDLRYLHASGWRAQAEYLDRTGDDNPTDLANGMSANAKAWYVQLSKRWTFDSKWIHYIEPVVQVDRIDWNKRVQDKNDKLTKAIGVVYSPIENYLFKFEYDFVGEKGPRIDNNKLWLAAVIEF